MLCACGCGLPTNVAQRTVPHLGYVKGEPYRFRHGHRSAQPGYRRKAVGTASRLQRHRARAERALGKPLPSTAHVHHADGSSSEDAPLVICQDDAYHHLLHIRMRIVRAGGDPNTQKLCRQCGQVKDKNAFSAYRSMYDGRHSQCRSCYNARQRRNHRLRQLRRTA